LLEEGFADDYLGGLYEADLTTYEKGYVYSLNPGSNTVKAFPLTPVAKTQCSPPLTFNNTTYPFFNAC